MTIAPFVQGTETYRRWLQKTVVYTVSMTAAAAGTGVAIAAAGAGVSALWSGMTLPLAVALGAVALVYALRELGFVRVPVPGRDWIVPAEWVRHSYYRSGVVWGVLVGAGVFTRVPFAALPVLAAWLFISGDVGYGVLAGAIYGLTRAASIYSAASSHDTEELVGLMQHIMRLSAPAHQATGLMLATLGAYLVTAPYIS